MIDPLTIGVCVVIAVANVVAFKGGRWAEHRAMLRDPEGKAALRDKLQIAERHVERLEYNLKNTEGWYAQWKAAAETNAKERDKFKKMAETHEVKWPEPPKPKHTTTEVWDDRRYSNHPAENLKALATDLAQFKDREVTLTLSLVFVGGWNQIVQNARMSGDNFKKMVFAGPPERVVAEITTFMHDHDMTFMSPTKPADKYHHASQPLNPDIKLKWNDIDSVMIWKINLSVSETLQPALKPEIHIVEVPVVETRTVEIEKVVERVVEKTTIPVREVEALVNEVLARKSAEAEVEAISPEETARRRLALAQRASSKVGS